MLGFDNRANSLALTGTGLQAGFSDQIAYLALAETLRLGIEARLSRTGAFADTATDMLQSQREIAYGDARRRDRQSAQASDDIKSQAKSVVRVNALIEESA